jgi:hypothetical protein
VGFSQLGPAGSSFFDGLFIYFPLPVWNDKELLSNHEKRSTDE